MMTRQYRCLLISGWVVVTQWTVGASALYQGGGLTILSQNRLNNYSNDGSAAILINQNSTYPEGSRICQLLNEAVWDSGTRNFQKTLKNSLNYQVFTGLADPSTLFWVHNSRSTAKNCSAIDSSGNRHKVSCSERLPTLCTQSAQLSPANSSLADNSEHWQVQQAVGGGNGTIMTGYRDYHTWKFRGIRYTSAPQRFTYSTVPIIQTGIVNATLAGADCSQPIGEVTSGSSEDCLFLNIWTTHLPQALKAPRQQELKPVMVYFYGGGLTSGSGKNPNTDGTNLASRGDVVVVSVNYRVGILGFLPFNDGVHSGNYAFSDQVTSLLWVQQYIQYFGGDPNRVTIFGESAGAQSVHVLLGSEAAAGKRLFKGAIMQSDPTSTATATGWNWAKYSTIEDAYRTGTMQVLNATRCQADSAAGQIGCLAKYTGFELVNIKPNFNGIVVDGTYVTSPYLVLNRTGIASDVAVMTGVNRDEAGVFINAAPTANESFTTYYNQQVRNTSSIGANFIDSVPLTPFDVPSTRLPTTSQILNASLAIQTDGIFTCFDLAKAYTAAKHGAFASTYSFVFNRTYSPRGYTRTWCDAPNSTMHPHGDPDKEYFKCHAGEQSMVFGTTLRSGRPDRDGLDVPFMQLVVDYWAAFARGFDPNPDPAYLAARGYSNTSAQVKAGGIWEPVNSADPQMRLLQWNGGQIPFFRGDQCRAIGAPLEVLE